MRLHSPHFRLFIGLLTVLLLLGGIFLMLGLVKKPLTTQSTFFQSTLKNPTGAFSGAVQSSLKSQLLDHSTITIMPLGDSITAGVGSSTHAGYRGQLWSDCLTAHWHVQFVGSQLGGPPSLTDREHEGHPGWRIRQIAAHVVDWLQTYKPRVVLLQIGTNDIVYHDAMDAAPDRLRSLILQIHETLPNTTIIVAQITPLRNAVLNSQVITYNLAIPSVVQGLTIQGLPVRYVDMYHAVPVSDLEDGIHPNDSGYNAMAGVWYSALHSLLTPIG
jgi:lysophospholipase L1-like esterase